MKLHWRIWLLILVLIASAIVIAPSFQKGVIIKSVEKNSTAFDQGLKTGMIIQSINGEKINNFADYTKVISSIFPKDNKTTLRIGTKEGEFVLFTSDAPNITVADIPTSKIKTGLDLSGGARALVKPEVPVSSKELDDLIAITSNRFNEFGIADVSVKPVSDLSGNNFMLIEVAGATPNDLNELVSQQGKFEAKIGNETVFIGGHEDITYVARTGEQSGIYACNTYQDGEL
jgi:hypothetical protein